VIIFFQSTGKQLIHCAVRATGFVAKPFNYHEEVALEISAVTNLGMGIGRIDGWVVMVPAVCVGETAIVRIYKNLKNYSLGDLLSIANPSPLRCRPLCPLFGSCGGCQYQHMLYVEQLRIKRNHVADAMQRIGGVETAVSQCIGCAASYAYRLKITPHFQKQVPPIGFLGNGTRKIVDVENCPIATDGINGALGGLRNSIIARNGTLTKGGTLLLRDGGDRIVTDSRETITQKIGDMAFSFRAGEFFQNNGHLLQKLVNFVAEAATGPEYLIDAYCGVGVFAIAAAKHFRKVIAVEISEVAITFAVENAMKNGVTNADFVAADAKHIFEQIPFPGNGTSVIVDPPRSGCDRDFLDQLMAYAPQKIIYVSCASDTQARDMKLLSSMYAVVSVQPFDMFPQTRHIENVLTLQRIAAN
jgi:23S rRNA (uracil1939-C5)-methyltransferase/tRNA (uracil-5-)-methyltransferase